MAGRERFSLASAGSTIVGFDTVAINATIAVAIQTPDRDMQIDNANTFVEPSRGGHDLDQFNRLVWWAWQTISATNLWPTQLQMSRDQGTTWVDVGDPVEATLVLDSTQAVIGDSAPNVIDGIFPPDFMTDSAAADVITDKLWVRCEITPGETNTGSFAYLAMLLPSLKASQAKPMRGNVFSGAQF